MDERREYFRIDDNAYIGCIPIDERHDSIPEYFPKLSQISLYQQLSELEKDTKELIEQISDKLTHKILSLQNQKIDIISRYVQADSIAESGLAIQKIEVSEGGVGFFHHSEIAPNTEVAIMLLFTPSYEAVYSKAAIVDCRKENEQFNIHCSFINLEEQQRQKLARHLLKQQTRQRD